jgi:hypothetical protein
MVKVIVVVMTKCCLERNYQFKINNIMRTKFANLMKPVLLIGAIMCCFSSCNTKIDPKCVKCGGLLSELSHVSPNNLLVNSHIIGHDF